MERLTVFDGEFWVHKDFPPVGADTVDEFVDCVKALAARLAAIEDILGDDYDLDRLRELVEADRDGRCVVLPCKVGDEIYKIFCGGAVKLEVERIVCWSSGFWKLNAHTDRKYTDWKGFEIDFSDFGKTVFLAHEVTEAALKGKGNPT